MLLLGIVIGGGERGGEGGGEGEEEGRGGEGGGEGEEEGRGGGGGGEGEEEGRRGGVSQRVGMPLMRSPTSGHAARIIRRLVTRSRAPSAGTE